MSETPTPTGAEDATALRRRAAVGSTARGTMGGLARLARAYGGMTATDRHGNTIRHVVEPEGELAKARLRTEMARKGWHYVRTGGGFMQFSREFLEP